MASSHFYEPAPRTGHAFVDYKGRTYLVGGLDYNSQPISLYLIDIFDPTTFEWQKCNTSGDIPEEVSYAAYATVGSILYLFGGCLRESIMGTMSMLDLESLKWSFVKQKKGPSPRTSARMVADGVDKLLLYGGTDVWDQTLSDLHIFSIKDGEWCKTTLRIPTKVSTHTQSSLLLVRVLGITYIHVLPLTYYSAVKLMYMYVWLDHFHLRRVELTSHHWYPSPTRILWLFIYSAWQDSPHLWGAARTCT